MAWPSRAAQQADPRDRAEVYAQLGLRLTYQNTQRLVLAQIGRPRRHVPIRVSEGDLNQIPIVAQAVDLQVPG
jgi:hypothetical protein